MTIPWDDKYRIGHERIDLEHQELFRLANVVMDLRGADRESLGAIFHGLAKYVKYHFANEEQLMQWVGYPGLMEQRIMHKSIIRQMDDLLTSAKSLNDLQAGLQKFMHTWMVKHICEMDIKIGRHIAERDVAAKPPA